MAQGMAQGMAHRPASSIATVEIPEEFLDGLDGLQFIGAYGLHVEGCAHAGAQKQKAEHTAGVRHS